MEYVWSISGSNTVEQEWNFFTFFVCFVFEKVMRYQCVICGN